MNNKKKITPVYETKTFSGKVVLKSKQLPSGVVIKVKDIEYDHPIYRQFEIDRFSVGDEILTKITNKKRLRTNEQNRFQHLYFSLIALSHGHGVTTEYVKNWAKAKHLSKGITEIFGDRVRKVKGTSELKVLEMIEFLARVEADTGIPIPDTKPFQFGISHEEFAKLKDEQKQKYLAMRPELSPLQDVSRSDNIEI